MEAIVLGVKNGRAALLLEDGTTTYRYMKCRPGQRVEVPVYDNAAGFVPCAVRTAAAAAAFALVVSGGTLYATGLPVSYVTEDVNPSMEYSLNRLDRVIGVAALNEDAEAIVDGLAVSGGTIQAAVGAAGERMEAAGDFDEDDYMLFSVASDSQQRAQKLENELSAMLGGQDEDSANFSVLRVSKDERRAARKLDMSAGRYKEMLNAKGEDAASDRQLVSEFQRKSVREMLGGAADEAEENAVQAVDGRKDTKVDVREVKKDNGDSDADEVKSASETEEKQIAPKQSQPKPRSAVPAQSQPVNPPSGNPQPAEPSPQPQQSDGGNTDTPAVGTQPTETPQAEKDEKPKEGGGKPEEKKTKDDTDKADAQKEKKNEDGADKDMKPDSDGGRPDDGPSGGEPLSGGGPGGPP